jgi:hypothetical protein
MLTAYLQHNHLVLRPDDIWFAILVQFSFYVNGHAEDLRSLFVSHAGKKKLKIRQDELDIPALVEAFTAKIAENIKDPALREWIMPDFTTTTPTDRMTAAIIMIGTLQKYFAYFLDITCGIPSVTLLGSKADWQTILQKLEFLSTLGKEHEELTMWKSVLSAIIGNFVKTFEAPDSPAVVRFWQKSVHWFQRDYSSQRITGWYVSIMFSLSLSLSLVAKNKKKKIESHYNGIYTLKKFPYFLTHTTHPGFV